MLKVLRVPKKRWDRIDKQVGEKIGYPLKNLDIDVTWPNLKTHVLVVHDKTDKEVHFSCHQAWLDAVPHARELVTDGFGHRRILAAQEVLEAGISFLAEDTEMNIADTAKEDHAGQEASRDQ